MIEFGSEKRRSGIIRLWIEAFGDTEETINGFLDNMYESDRCVLCIEEDEVAAMAFILPVSSGDHKGRYVYAVATAKKHRGKGLCRKIMAFIDEHTKSLGESFLILVPAEKSLFDFYGKMGYSQTVIKPPEAKIQKTGKNITAGEYYKIRAEIFAEFDLIEWDEKSLSYILSHGVAKETEGGAVYLEDNKAVEVLTPEIFKEEWKEPFALIKYVDDIRFEKPYFGLAMN